MANSMDGLTGIIGQLLSDPQAKEKINQVISALSNTGTSENSGDAEEPGQDLLNLDTIGNGINLAENDIITKAVNALSGLNAKNDPRVNLLESLKPYMRATRAGKIDLAVKVMQFSRIAPLFGLNLFGNKNSGE